MMLANVRGRVLPGQRSLTAVKKSSPVWPTSWTTNPLITFATSTSGVPGFVEQWLATDDDVPRFPTVGVGVDAGVERHRPALATVVDGENISDCLDCVQQFHCHESSGVVGHVGHRGTLPEFEVEDL
jgi:hypothetical protein